ncbi:hypothetical protein, partial [Bathymodiolus thermophilus thioautotrophic gill symbiont]|uniref:hypothetical protein n=1 Tax=Bathymodiolus thermophilus thioautotrophic gill symbiont TaxID=2360 RepID=UPI001A7E15F3
PLGNFLNPALALLGQGLRKSPSGQKLNFANYPYLCKGLNKFLKIFITPYFSLLPSSPNSVVFEINAPYNAIIYNHSCFFAINKLASFNAPLYLFVTFKSGFASGNKRL